MENVVEDASDLKLKINAIKALRKYSTAKWQKRRKEEYIKSFYHRGLKRSSIIGFKMFSRIIDKEALREKLEQNLAAFEQNYIKGSFAMFTRYREGRRIRSTEQDIGRVEGADTDRE